MKRCARCGSEKALDDFYKTASGSAMHVCKSCHKKHMADLRRDNPDVRERDRMRAKHPKKAAQIRETSRRWRENNPDAYKAQNAVNNALRDGKIKREPCAICAATERIHAHHKDYSKPLDVVWLCARCHHRLHAVFPELEGANKRTA